MKICRKHKKFLKRGQTYQLVSKKECILCHCDTWQDVLDALQKYGD